MKLILVMIILWGCGGKSDHSNRCISGEEKRLRCQADAISKWYPTTVPQYENTQCLNMYPQNGGCY